MNRKVARSVLTFALGLSAGLETGCAQRAAAPPSTTAPAGGGARMARLTRVTAKAIEIDEKIQFELGMATILPASDALLTEIVDDLKQHPEIIELQIEGHASSDGDPQSNQDLSQRRADAVKAWLVAHGIAESRLVARGFGQDRPIAPNDTEDGREKNRRVELNIVKHN